MDNHFVYTNILAILLGILGGISSHVTWLVSIARRLAESNKSLSVSKKAVRSRIALFFLSFVLGLVSGAVAGLITYDQKAGLSVIMSMSFFSGYAMDTFVAKLGKLGLG